jgi:general stress protein CsbA
VKYPEEQLIRPGLLLGAPGQHVAEDTHLRQPVCALQTVITKVKPAKAQPLVLEFVLLLKSLELFYFMRGFLLITVMILTLLIGGVMLNLFQQSIRQRFQSQAFLESQILFQELSGAAVQAQNYLLQFTPNQLQENPPVLESSVFAEGFKDWSGSVKTSGSDLLITLRAPNDSGGADFQLLLRNADNTSGIEYLKPDGVLILEN